MFRRMIFGLFTRQSKKMLVIAFTIALGASLATAMLNVMLGVEDKVNAELKTYGANITVIPKEASLLDDLYGMESGQSDGAVMPEENEKRIKEIFWGHNIIGYAPYFTCHVHRAGQEEKTLLWGTWFSRTRTLSSGEVFTTGLVSIKSWWEMEGAWPSDEKAEEIMVGKRLAEKWGVSPGDHVSLHGGNGDADCLVKAVFSSGSSEDDAVYAPLELSQRIGGGKGLLTSIDVAALTTPDNDLARKAARNPKSLTLKEWEAWYCTAYVSAVCYQLEDAMTGVAAKAVRQVAESEGVILEKMRSLMTMIAVLAMLGATFGISNLVTTSVMERSREIGLMKAIGAKDHRVKHLILSEMMLIGLLGGLIGYLIGLGFTQIIGLTVFGSAIPFAPMAIPLVLVMILLVTFFGSLPAMRYLARLKPADVLHGR